MARRKERVDTGIVFFDVYYEDGSRASNRKVPAAEADGLDGDARVRTVIMEQDRRIADLSGKAPREISRIVRSQR
jgi:hypothetical protein